MSSLAVKNDQVPAEVDFDQVLITVKGIINEPSEELTPIESITAPIEFEEKIIEVLKENYYRAITLIRSETNVSFSVASTYADGLLEKYKLEKKTWKNRNGIPENTLEIYDNTYEPPEYRTSYFIPKNSILINEDKLNEHKIIYAIYVYNGCTGYVLDGINYKKFLETFKLKETKLWCCAEWGLKYVELDTYIRKINKITNNVKKEIRYKKHRIRSFCYNWLQFNIILIILVRATITTISIFTTYAVVNYLKHFFQ